MDCPKCGYDMSPFDAECPRCRRLAAEGKSPAAAAAHPPMQLTHHGRTFARSDEVVRSSPQLALLAFVGSTLAGGGTGFVFGTMLKACLGGG